jgi:hypothetical protein
MLGKELANMVTDGVRPVVTFNKKVENKEGYFEAGMRGRLTAIRGLRDDVFELIVDVREFDEYNKQFETANYFDKSGKPTLTAREAGFYSADGHLEVYTDTELEVDFLEIEEPSRLQVYQDYVKSGEKVAYVQWLESQLHIARQSR